LLPYLSHDRIISDLRAGEKKEERKGAAGEERRTPDSLPGPLPSGS